MSRHRSTTGGKWLLFGIFFIGIMINLALLLDAEWLHFLIKSPQEAVPTSTGRTPSNDSSVKLVEQAKESILLVCTTKCDDPSSGGCGTGFFCARVMWPLMLMWSVWPRPAPARSN
ncbi:MAG: hypothetical protein HQK58_16925 [Deltaproteobacteria bacterium]|nr:hypothetical protein [Deltaproteobacteria bacterium]